VPYYRLAGRAEDPVICATSGSRETVRPGEPKGRRTSALNHASKEMVTLTRRGREPADLAVSQTHYLLVRRVVCVRMEA